MNVYKDDCFIRAFRMDLLQLVYIGFPNTKLRDISFTTYQYSLIIMGHFLDHK